jgi:hypothetical protein
MQIQVNQYLCWEQARPTNNDQVDFWTTPQSLRDCLPQWFVDLPGNLQRLDIDSDCPDHDILVSHGMRSAKLCLGLRGIRSLGWTIPLAHNYTDSDTPAWKQTWLHPAMLTGSGFDSRNDNGTYQWGIRLLSFPWRARMAPGWRLMITGHPLSWSQDWFCFSGCVDANYSHDGRNIGSFWQFERDMDLDCNYYNIEVVVAVKNKPAQPPVVIESGTCLFSLIPVYDPDYQATEFKEFPNFVTSSRRA